MITRTTTDTDTLVYRAAALALVAGVIHGLATSQYMGRWLGYGVFFIVVAMAQIVYGVGLLLRPWRYDVTGGSIPDDTEAARPYYLAGILMNGTLVVIYLITRTIGIPLLGPEAGSVEPVTALGVLSKLTEIALIAHLVVLIRRLG